MATENKVQPNLEPKMYALGKNISFAKDARDKLRRYRVTQWVHNERKEYPEFDNDMLVKLYRMEIEVDSKFVTLEKLQSAEVELSNILCKLLKESLEELESCKKSLPSSASYV